MREKRLMIVEVERVPHELPDGEFRIWCADRGFIPYTERGRHPWHPGAEAYLGSQDYLLYIDGVIAGFAMETDLVPVLNVPGLTGKGGHDDP